MHIRPRTNQPLHDWVLNSDSNGANPDALTLNEYDGYINFEGVGGSTASIHMPWHVLPRGAGNIQSGVRQNGLNWYRNTSGVAASYIDTYSLIGMSDQQPDAPSPGWQRGSGRPALCGCADLPGSSQVLRRRAVVCHGLRGQHLGSLFPCRRQYLD